ncbi:hypothetical protein ACLMNJ_20415, partial [Streptomyces seoulensis]
MTKKTRIRVARIAAGAVVAAGASLMVAGVASADPGPGDPTPCDIVLDPTCGDQGGNGGDQGGNGGDQGGNGGDQGGNGGDQGGNGGDQGGNGGDQGGNGGD